MDGSTPRNDSVNSESMAHILDCEVRLEDSNVFGEVKSGLIKLRAPLIPLILDPRIDPEGTGHPYDTNPKLRTENGPSEGINSRLDIIWKKAFAMVASLEGVQIFALVFTLVKAAISPTCL